MACPEFFTFSNGEKMPVLGFGTSQARDEALEQALHAALEAGYRHIDTAEVYRNEHVIGKVLSSWISQGKLRREELFITTKLASTGYRQEHVHKHLEQSLQRLRLDYVDLYLIHNPCGLQERGDELFPTGPDGSALLDVTTDHVTLWKGLEAEVDAGRAKAIGISNFTETQIQRVLDSCRIKPANLQVELHVYLQQKQLVDFCARNGISVTAYSPLGSPGSAAFLASRARSAAVPEVLSDATVNEIARKHKKKPAQILLRHLVQKGVIPIPKSTNRERLAQNIQIFDFKLDPTDMAKLDALDRGEEGRIFILHEFLKGLEKHPEYPFQIRRTN